LLTFLAPTTPLASSQPSSVDPNASSSAFMEHSSDILVFVSMSERATTKLIGLSVSGIFLVMLMLNAVTP
jgi:hypothetical protein